MKQLGISGHIGHFDVFVMGDTVIVTTEKKIEAKKTVEGLSDFVKRAKDLRLGWVETEDYNIIYLYDKADDCFGYALNVEDPELSEWGYAPFCREEKA